MISNSHKRKVTHKILAGFDATGFTPGRSPVSTRVYKKPDATKSASRQPRLGATVFASTGSFYTRSSDLTIDTAKSIFEMTSEEFDQHVTPRSNELANDRWNKGLYISVPAGEGYKKNEFFRIYKDKSKKLFELNTTTGEETFIRDIR